MAQTDFFTRFNAMRANTTDNYGFFDDCMSIGDPVVTTGRYIKTVKSTGTIANLNTTASDVTTPGGWWKFSGAATTDNSGAQLQTPAFLSLTPNRRTMFVARILASEATNIDIGCGLCVPLTDVIGTVLPNVGSATDAVLFGKNDDVTSLAGYMNAASATNISEPNLAPAFTASVAHEIGIQIDMGSGTQGVYSLFYDGALLFSDAHTTFPLSTVMLGAYIGMQSGTATGTISMNLDYWGCYSQR